MVDSESEESICTPPDVKNRANIATAHLLPDKSRGRYERTYNKFLEWCSQRGIQKFSENVLLAYFEQHESKNSLWSVYSMLKLCLITNNNVDISKFPRLIAYLKRRTEHHKPKKSAVLDDNDMSKFLNEAPDSSYLMMKVALILGISGALRREELCKMKPSDIEFRNDVVVVTIPETKTGTPRSFAITLPEWINKLKTYTNLRKPNDQRYFLTYHNGKCTSMPVGINTIGKIPMKIAQFLRLENPSTFTGHSFRRTSATMLANHGGGLIGIKQLGGWKSSSVAESYIQD